MLLHLIFGRIFNFIFYQIFPTVLVAMFSGKNATPAAYSMALLGMDPKEATVPDTNAALKFFIRVAFLGMNGAPREAARARLIT